jgi:methionyl-tRNA formyltransferase
MAEGWRVSMICTIKPIADTLAGALRELGHEPVSLLAPRRPEGEPQPEFLQLTASSAPPGVDLLFAKDKWSIERLLRAYEPDLTVCWGFPWKIPREALDVARLGSINGHPVRLDVTHRRHRLGLHLASHGRRARHGQHPRARERPDPRRRLRHR